MSDGLDNWLAAYVRYLDVVRDVSSRRLGAADPVCSFQQWVGYGGKYGGGDVRALCGVVVCGDDTVAAEVAALEGPGGGDLGVSGGVAYPSDGGVGSTVLGGGDQGCVEGQRSSSGGVVGGVLAGATVGEREVGASGLREATLPKRGKWYDHNRAKKERRRRQGASSAVPEWRRKPAVREDDAVSDGSSGLQASLEAKWIEENKLAALKAIQQRELLEARDLDKIKRMQAAQVMRTTEQAKVQTEKAFGFLAKTGNVPGVAGEGYVEGTVLTNATPGLTRSAGDTISPDSSASMHEYRLALKEVADEKKKVADLERALARLRIVVPEETAEAERYAGARTTFTLDTDGEPPVADEGFIGDDGKYHTFQRLTHPDWTPSTEKAMAKQGLDMYYDDGY